MIFLYAIGIRVYGILVLISSLFYNKASLWIKGRKSQFTDIEKRIQKWGNDPAIIIHAASYGEYEICLLYTSPSPRDATLSRMPSSA